MFGGFWRGGGESDQVCSVFEDGGDDYESRAGTGVSERGESGFGEVGGVRQRSQQISREEVNRAFKWLKNPVREERKRFAAALTLRELAANAPTVFNVHVPHFIKAVWPALHDPSLDVRLAGKLLALRACLMVIEQRETRYRVQWYYKLYEEVRKV